MGFLRDGEIHAHPASVQHLARHNAAGFFRVLQAALSFRSELEHSKCISYLEVFEGDESKASRGPVRCPNYLRVADPSVSPKLLLQVHFTRVITERKYEVGSTT